MDASSTRGVSVAAWLPATAKHPVPPQDHRSTRTPYTATHAATHMAAHTQQQHVHDRHPLSGLGASVCMWRRPALSSPSHPSMSSFMPPFGGRVGVELSPRTSMCSQPAPREPAGCVQERDGEDAVIATCPHSCDARSHSPRCPRAVPCFLLRPSSQARRSTEGHASTRRGRRCQGSPAGR